MSKSQSSRWQQLAEYRSLGPVSAPLPTFTSVDSRPVRDVVLMPSLGRLLRAHRLASRYSGDGDYMFASLTGGPMHYRNLVRRGFAKSKETTGIDEGRETPLVFHDLRRTFGSLLIAQGCDVVYVSRQMGHSSVGVTLSVYAKEFDGRRHSADASARMESAFGEGLA